MKVIFLFMAITFSACGEYEWSNPIDPNCSTCNSSNSNGGGDSGDSDPANLPELHCTEDSSVPVTDSLEVIALSTDGTNLWVAKWNPTTTKTRLSRTSSTNGSVSTSFEVDLEGVPASDITYDENDNVLWATTATSNKRYEIELPSGNILSTVQASTFGRSIAHTGLGSSSTDDFWIGDSSDEHTIYRISKTNSILATKSNLSFFLGALAYGNTTGGYKVWISGKTTASETAPNAIFRMNDTTQTIDGYCLHRTDALTYHQNSLWVPDNSSHEIIELEVSE